MKQILEFFNLYNHDQWSIILESISFVLVTLDLYGSERLENLNSKIDSKIAKYINQIKGAAIVNSIQKNNSFILSSIKYLWILYTSPILSLWNMICGLLNWPKKEVNELSDIHVKQTEKFITILFYIGVATALITVSLLIYFSPGLDSNSNIVYIYILLYFGFAAIGLLFAILANKIWEKPDWVSFFESLLAAPLGILIVSMLPIFLILFFIYFYLVPSLLLVPLGIMNIVLKTLLLVIVKFKLKNIMLLFGSALFFLSKYLSFIS